MKKYIILLTFILIPSLIKGAVGDRFYYNGICYTITQDVVVFSSTSYAQGVVKVGLDNGFIVSHGSGDVSIPEKVIRNGYYYAVGSIANDAFKNSTSLTSINLPSTISKIGERAFYGCTSLTTINFPNQVKSIYTSTFEGCVALDNLNLNNVSSIGAGAFKGCEKLKSLVLPENTVSLGNSSFEGCISLNTVSFMANKINFGNAAFRNCKSLETVYSYMTDITGLSYSDCFSGIATNATLYVVNGMKKTYENSINWRSSFQNINVISPTIGERFYFTFLMGNGVEQMEFEISDVENMNVSLVSLVDGLISSKSEVISLVIPSNVSDKDNTYSLNSIRNSVFDGTKIETLCLPGFITRIGSAAFANCDFLKSVFVEWRNPAVIDIAEDSFEGIPNDAVLYVPAGTKERYEALKPWNNFSQIVESSPISTGDIPARFNSQANLPIYLKNTETVEGLQFKLTLPNGVTVAERNDMLVTSTTERTEGMTIMGKKDPDEENSYLFVLFSLDGNPITGTEGSIMNIRLNIASDVELGTYDIMIEDVYMTTDTYETLNPAESSSELTVKDYMLGDVNNDGIINVTDAIGIVNHVLKNTPAVFIEGAADVNQDGIVNVTDAIAVINMILS